MFFKRRMIVSKEFKSFLPNLKVPAKPQQGRLSEAPHKILLCGKSGNKKGSKDIVASQGRKKIRDQKEGHKHRGIWIK